MSKQRQKGTAAESALVGYLRDNGYPNTKRMALTGSADQGDIDWLTGITVEVKSVRTPKYGEWLRQAEKERQNAGNTYGLVVHKPHGTGLTDQGSWHVVMTLDTLLSLLRDGGLDW
jgi:hypothetical protein